LYIDPRSKESLISKMGLLTKNINLLNIHRCKSKDQAGKFSWDNTARITLEVYEKTMAEKPWFEC
jgi:hypothetical protein